MNASRDNILQTWGEIGRELGVSRERARSRLEALGVPWWKEGRVACCLRSDIKEKRNELGLKAKHKVT